MDIGGRRTFAYLANGAAHAVEINTLRQNRHVQLEESGILGVLLWLWLKLHGLDFGHKRQPIPTSLPFFQLPLSLHFARGPPQYFRIIFKGVCMRPCAELYSPHICVQLAFEAQSFV